MHSMAVIVFPVPGLGTTKRFPISIGTRREKKDKKKTYGPNITNGREPGSCETTERTACSCGSLLDIKVLNNLKVLEADGGRPLGRSLTSGNKIRSSVNTASIA